MVIINNKVKKYFFKNFRKDRNGDYHEDVLAYNNITKLNITRLQSLVVMKCLRQCFFCKRIFSGTHILIFDWRPQYSTCTSLRQ